MKALISLTLFAIGLIGTYTQRVQAATSSVVEFQVSGSPILPPLPDGGDGSSPVPIDQLPGVSAGSLPATGDASGFWLIMLGVLILLGLCWWGSRKRRFVLGVLLTLGIGLGSFGGQSVRAVAAMPVLPSEPWLTPAAYPQPQEPFLAFDQVLSPVGASRVLKNDKTHNVAVEIAKGTYQSGSIWSDAPLSLKSDFTAAMLVNFGNFANPADGVAFALSGRRPDHTYHNGSALGVWKSNAGGSTPGLPNSFALVFDTQHNSDRQDAEIDAKYPQYVGWGFPGEPAQYGKSAGNDYRLHWGTQQVQTERKPHRPSTSPGLGGYVGLYGHPLTDGAWHHLDIKWQADATHDGGGSLTFGFAVNGETITRTLSWEATKAKDIFGSDQVYWGFTGSTGALTENAVVAFQSIPGLLHNGMTATLDAQSRPVYPGTKLTQHTIVAYDGTQSKQAWPLITPDQAHTLATTLTTGKNYAFVVGKDGKVALGNGVFGTPVKPYVKVIDGAEYTLSDQVTVAIAGFDKNAGQQSRQLDATVIATQVGAAATVNAGSAVGDNGIVQATVATPAVVAKPEQVLNIPNFDFGQLSVAQVIKGVHALPGTPKSGISLHVPTDSNYKITVAMPSFALGERYTAGHAHLNLTYQGQTLALADDDAPHTLSPLHEPTTAITAASLTLDAFPQVVAKAYAPTLNWTLAAVPA